MGPGTDTGTYGVIEAELNLPANTDLSGPVSFIHCSFQGTDAAEFDTSGYLFNIQGATGAEGKFFDDAAEISNVNEITGGLRIRVGAADYYILLASAADTADA
jgi:hypothetical protein